MRHHHHHHPQRQQKQLYLYNPSWSIRVRHLLDDFQSFGGSTYDFRCLIRLLLCLHVITCFLKTSCSCKPQTVCWVSRVFKLYIHQPTWCFLPPKKQHVNHFQPSRPPASPPPLTVTAPLMLHVHLQWPGLGREHQLGAGLRWNVCKQAGQMFDGIFMRYMLYR